MARREADWDSVGHRGSPATDEEIDRYSDTRGDWDSDREDEDAPETAQNGSYYGELNDAGRPKTVYVDGYYRRDGTYVRSHYRSEPRE